jgi:hypothetical protein
MRLAARSTVVAICLAIVALAPAAAFARPAFDPPIVTVNPPTGYTLQDKSVSHTTVVRSNPDQQVARHGVPVPPILGKTQAAEQATIDRLKAHPLVDSRPTGRYSTAALNGNGRGNPVSVQAPKTLSASPGNGFDWGDAAIGAAVGLSLTLLVVGGAMMLSRRRSPQGDSAHVATT